jgi:hypothetical protein
MTLWQGTAGFRGAGGFAGPRQHWDPIHIQASLSGGGTTTVTKASDNQVYGSAFGTETTGARKIYWETALYTDPANIGQGGVAVGIGTPSTSVDQFGDRNILNYPGPNDVILSDASNTLISWTDSLTWPVRIGHAYDAINNLYWVTILNGLNIWNGNSSYHPGGTGGVTGLGVGVSNVVPNATGFYTLPTADSVTGYFDPSSWIGDPPYGFNAFDFTFTPGGSFQAAGGLRGTSIVALPASASFAGAGGFVAKSAQWLAAPASFAATGALAVDAAQRHWLNATGVVSGAGALSELVYQNYRTNPASFTASDTTALITVTYGAYPGGAVFSAAGALAASAVLTLPIFGSSSAVGALAVAPSFAGLVLAGFPGAGNLHGDGPAVHNWTGSASLAGAAVAIAPIYRAGVAWASFSGSGRLRGAFVSRDGPPQHWDDVHLNANISGAGTASPLLMNGSNIYAPAYCNESGIAEKKYWEITVTNNSNDGVGLGNTSSSVVDGQWLGIGSDTLGVYLSGGTLQIFVSGVAQATYTVNWLSGDLLAFAVDFGNGLLWIRDITANSAWYGSGIGDPAAGTNGFSLTQAGFTITSAPVVPATSLYANQDTTAGYFAPISWTGVPPLGFDAFDYKFSQGGSFPAAGGFTGTAVAVHEVSVSGSFAAAGSLNGAITALWPAGVASFAATGSTSLVTLAAVSAAASLSAASQFAVLETVAHADLRFIYASFSGSAAAAFQGRIVSYAAAGFAASAGLAATGFIVHPTVFAAFAGSGTFVAYPTQPPIQLGFAGGGGFSMPKPVLELIITPPAPSLTSPHLGDHVAYLNGQRWDGRAFDGNFIFAPPHWDDPNAGTVGGCGAGVLAIVQPDGAGTQGELIINPAGPGVGVLSGPITDYATIQAVDPAVSQIVGFGGSATLAVTATNLGGDYHFWPDTASFVASGGLAATSTLTYQDAAAFGAAASFVSVVSATLPATASFGAVGALVSIPAVTVPTTGSFSGSGGIAGTANMSLPQSAIFGASGNLSGSITQVFLAAFEGFAGYAEIDALTAQRYSVTPASFSGYGIINGQPAQNFRTNETAFSAAGNVVAVSAVVTASVSASFINDSWFSVKENAALPSAAAFSADSTFTAAANVNIPGFATLLAAAGFTASATGGLFPSANFAAAGSFGGQISPLLLGTTVRFAATGGLHANATLSVQQAAVFAGNGAISTQPSIAIPASASMSSVGNLAADSFRIYGTYWVGEAQFGGAASLSGVVGVIQGQPLQGDFAGTGGLSAQAYPIIDLTDIGAPQTSPQSVRSFIYTGIDVTIDQLEPGTLILALEFDPLPPPSGLRSIAYDALDIPAPSFDGCTAIWDYGGTNQVMTRVQSLPSPAFPSPPGLGDFTIAFTLQNPAPGSLDLLISWTEPSAQVSAYAVTYGHGIPGPGPAPVAAESAETDFHVNVGRFLNRRRVLVE